MHGGQNLGYQPSLSQPTPHAHRSISVDVVDAFIVGSLSVAERWSLKWTVLGLGFRIGGAKFKYREGAF